jgi:hypothetical protein
MNPIDRELNMPRGEKSKYTDKQAAASRSAAARSASAKKAAAIRKRNAEHRAH